MELVCDDVSVTPLYLLFQEQSGWLVATAAFGAYTVERPEKVAGLRTGAVMREVICAASG